MCSAMSLELLCLAVAWQGARRVFLVFVPDKGVGEEEMLHWDKEKLLIHFVCDLNSGPVAIMSIPQSSLLDYWRKWWWHVYILDVLHWASGRTSRGEKKFLGDVMMLVISSVFQSHELWFPLAWRESTWQRASQKYSVFILWGQLML